MNTLLPIIRRKRRPLLPVEDVKTTREEARPTDGVNIQRPKEEQSLLTSAATKEIKHDAKVANTR